MDFTLIRNGNEKIRQNNIDYSKIFDKIVFEINANKYFFKENKDELEFQKEDLDTVFNLNNNKLATIFLKEYNVSMPIKVKYFQYKNINGNFEINYILETDDELVTIKIDFH